MIWIDGALVPEVATADEGLAVFETMGLFGGELRLWDRHLPRLLASLRRLGDQAAAPPGLRAGAEALLRSNGHEVLRLERRLRPRSGNWVMTTRARSAPDVVRVVPTLVRRPASAAPADLKMLPRDFYAAVQAEAHCAGCDDGIVLGDDGAVLETASSNLWLLLDAVWTTPSLDGRALPGIARALLLERARQHGVPVAERRVDLGDLHRAEMLVVSNAVHGPRPAALPGATVGETASSLQRLWRFAVPD